MSQAAGIAEMSPSRAPARLRAAYPLALAALVALSSLLPMVKQPRFYFWGDTAASFTPIFRRIAASLSDGQFPLLQVDMWRGGNFPAEAASGIYNPLVLGMAWISSQVNDLAWAAWVFKVVFMVILALGVYFLALDLGVTRQLALLVGYAAPFMGFALWSEASRWVSGLMMLSLYPWVWLTARQLVRGQRGVLPLLAAGLLFLLVGNPYAIPAFGIVLVAVLGEGWLNGVRRRLWLLVGTGATVMLAMVPVLLPFLATYQVGYRSAGGLFNNDFLRPGLTDIAGMSNPVLRPWMKAFGLEYLTYPGVYLAWFVVPLLAWVIWSRVPETLRARASLTITAALWLLMVIAPSNLSFFRWPMRLLPYLYLSLLLLWAVLISQGVARDHRRGRWLIMFGLIGFGAWIGFGERPVALGWQFGFMVGVAALCAGLVWVLLHRPDRVGLVGVPMTALVLAAQLFHMPVNANAPGYFFPTDVAQLNSDYSGEGRTLQIADLKLPDRGAYDDVLFGSMQSVAGRESPNAYSGIGYQALDDALCMRYTGEVCPELYERVFSPFDDSGNTLADYLGLDRVVVGKWMREDVAAPPGWRVSDDSEYTWTLVRKDPRDPALGTVSVAGEGTRIDSTGPDGKGREDIAFEKGPDSQWLTFARLAWPGYEATVNGEPIPVRSGPAGLLQVELPAGVTAGDLVVSWKVPGAKLSLAAILLALVATIGLVVMERRLRTESSGTVEKAGSIPAEPVTR